MKGLFSTDEFGYFQFPESGEERPSGFILDAGRVRNLKFTRQ